jgi:hypothetical protein
MMNTQLLEKFGTLANDASIAKTAASLKANGITVYVVQTAPEAKKKVFELIPQNAEVMDMTSQTLLSTGIESEINQSGRYNAVRAKLNAMDSKTQGSDMRRLGAAPAWAIGSVHAITEDGQVYIASMTGSQLPAYAYGAGEVLWVAGTQKIVKNNTDALKRIYEYVFPLEDQRALKAYGVHSSVNKILVVNKEAAQGRITIILVKEKLGF